MSSKKKSKKQLDGIWKDALSRNRCPYGCTITTSPCEHLEQYLNDNGGDARMVYSNNMDRYRADQGMDNRTITEEDHQAIVGTLSNMIEGMRKLGMEELRIQVILARVVEKLTYAQIAEEYNFVSPQMAHYFFKKSIKLLQERGYKPKVEAWQH